MTVIASQLVRDSLGRPSIHTKAAKLEANSVPPLSFRADAVTSVDPRTGVLTGAIASALPADGGYPYRGRTYENSPLSRVVAEGLPGADFAIVPDDPAAHPRRYFYGSNHALGDLPAGVLHTTTRSVEGAATGPIQGDSAQTTISSDLDGPIGHAATDDSGAPTSPPQMGFSRLDAMGNATTLVPPAYFDPPTGQGEAYCHEFDLGFRGDVSSWTAPDTGTSRYVYDPAGRLRFTQTAVGLAEGWFAYTRYDRLGRAVETGVVDGEWDEATLQDYADDDPSWPPSPSTWIRRTEFDGDGSDPFSLGRVTGVTRNNAAGEPVVERASYDAAGELLSRSLLAPSYDAATRTTTFERDALGNATARSFGTDERGSFEPADLSFDYDALGRLVEIGIQDGRRLATFGYNADGTLANETLDPDAAAPIKRSLDYLSPAWPSKITDAVAGKTFFSESLAYTTGGYKGAAYFDGRLAATDVELGWPGAPDGVGWSYLYDANEALVTAASTLGGDWDVGVATPLAYDANGNITDASRGTTAVAYGYAQETNQLTSVTAGQRQTRGYSYDAAGRVTQASGLGEGQLDVTFVYNGIGPLPVSASATGEASFEIVYQEGSAGRVLKQVGTDGSARLYQHADEAAPAVERERDAQGETVVRQYVYGPAGLCAVLTQTAAGTDTSFVLRDHEGSVRVVVDDDRSVAASYDYLPYGELARSAGPLADALRYRYTGQEFEPELGIYYYRARLYDPVVGRFLAPDPASELFSPYAYAEDDPLLYTDPTGNFGFLAILMMAGQALVDVALDMITAGAATPAEGALVSAEVAVDSVAVGATAAATAASSTTVASTGAAVATAEEATSVAATEGVTSGAESAAQGTATASAGGSSSGEAVVADGAESGANGAGSSSTTIVQRPPAGYRFVGFHSTSDAYLNDLAQGIQNTGPDRWLQLGRGFYVADDQWVAEDFGDMSVSVSRGGGRRALLEVWVRDVDQMDGAVVPEQDQVGANVGGQTSDEWARTPTGRTYMQKDYLRSTISGRRWQNNWQTKFNEQTFRNINFVRRYYSTDARTFTSSGMRSMPKPMNVTQVVRLLRFFR